MQKKQSALVELLEGGPLLFKKEIQKICEETQEQ